MKTKHTDRWVELSDWQILAIEEAVNSYTFPGTEKSSLEALRLLIKGCKQIKLR